MKLAHSYSAIKQFEQCPRQYHLVRILRKYKSPQSEAQKYGDLVHKAMENFLMYGQPLPPEFQQFLPYARRVAQVPGTMHCETKLGIRNDFSPCDFFDKDVWFRGMPDVMVIDGKRARIGDWKTGKSSRYADPDQLELMAAMVMAHYPEVEEVRGVLVFLVAQDAIHRTYTRSQFGEIMSHWAGRASQIEAAVESGVWNPRQSGLCPYCPVPGTACEFKEP